ncbi:MAG: prolyl oligopeptidase family serine peptidase [Gallionella sp.]|jgi:predicted esterase
MEFYMRSFTVLLVAHVGRHIRLFHILLLSVAITLAMTGCASVGERQAESEKPALHPETFIFKDKGQALYYTFEIGNPHPQETLVFFISGSGCASVKDLLQTYFEPMHDLGVRFFALQKRGITANSNGDFCSNAFEETDYSEHTLSDQQEFFDKTIAQLTTKPRAIVLIGASEGTTIAAKLAGMEPSITHLGLIGGGGWTQREDLRLLSHKVWYLGRPDETFRMIESDPNSLTRTAWGHSYKYWSSFLDIDIGDILLSLKIPIVLAMGQEDESVPVESSIAMKKRFDEQKNHNLILRIYPGADHRLRSRDKKTSYAKDFLNEISQAVRSGAVDQREP